LLAEALYHLDKGIEDENEHDNEEESNGFEKDRKINEKRLANP